MALHAEDAVFNNKSLSDFGFMLCEFDGNGSLNKNSVGSTIDLKTVKIKNNWKVTSSEYKEAVTFSITICKKDFSQISPLEQATINRYFIRKDGYKFLQFIMKEYEQIYFNVMCTDIKTISVGNIDHGLELTFISDAPYGYGKEEKYTIDVGGSSMVKNVFIDMSDEVGETYPNLKIEVYQDSAVNMTNELTNCNFMLKNCVGGEIITVNTTTGEITSTRRGNVVKDFNYNWFSFGNTYEKRNNPIMLTGRSKVTMFYRQIRKVGIG